MTFAAATILALFSCMTASTTNLHNDNTNIDDTLNNKMMRQLCYGRNSEGVFGVVVQRTMEAPVKARAGHVLVKVRAAGLNPVDAKGVIGDKLPHSWKVTRGFVDRNINQNKCIGFDFSGLVVDTSDDDGAPYKPGDAVFGTVPPYVGTLSEYIQAPLDQIQHKSKELSHVEAAAVPLVGLTCLQALSPYLIQDGPSSSSSGGGSSILVIGASGGTGHMACQVAKCLGTKTIIGICSRRNVDFVRQCGATHVVDYQEFQNNDELVEAVHKIQSEVDVVFDCVTSADPRDAKWDYPNLFRDMAKKRYLRLGGKSPDWMRAGFERIVPILSCFGKEKLFWIRFPKSTEQLGQLNEWIEGDNKLKPKLENEPVEFTTEAVQGAFDRILDRHVQGKIVVKVSES